jgi:hypothetical protein
VRSRRRSAWARWAGFPEATTQQLGGAIGLAVVVSVYAAGAVPGAFVPGAHAAFLTTAAFTLLAFIVTVLAVRPSWNKVPQSA